MRPGAGTQPPTPPHGRRFAGVARRPGSRCLLALLAALALLPLAGCHVWEQVLRGDSYKPVLAPPPSTSTATVSSAAAPAPTPVSAAPPASAPAAPKAPPAVAAAPVAEPSAAPARPGNPAAWGDPGRLGVGREFDAVYFNGQSTELDAVALQRLTAYADWLRAHPAVFITLAGHAGLDVPCSYAYTLGMARALAAADFFIGHGVEPRRVFTISYGRDMPLAPGTDAPAGALNNRVEVLGFVPPAGQAEPPAAETGAAAPPEADPAPPGITGKDLLQ